MKKYEIYKEAIHDALARHAVDLTQEYEKGDFETIDKELKKIGIFVIK